MPTRNAIANTTEPATRYDVRLSVSAQDRVSSLILSMLYLVGSFVFLLFLLWLTTRARDIQPTIAVEWDELPGGDASMGDGRDFQEPGLEEIQDLAVPNSETMLAAVTDLASTVQASSDAEVQDLSQGQGGGDRRRGGAGGDASVPRWERWEVRFTSSGLDNYAKQLDQFGIELAAAGGGRDMIDYAYQLSQPAPSTRSGPSSAERRLYMSYRSGQLKAFDRQLLNRAGIPTDGRLIVQFYPPAAEGVLARLERESAGKRQLREIQKTVFAVVNAGGSYQFEVVEQRYH